MKKLKNSLISVVIFLVLLKVVDVGLWLFSSDEPVDFQITETKMLREHIAAEVNKVGMEYAVLKNELLEVYYKQSAYHPYRWYSLPSNFQGKYIQTDSLGFRNRHYPTQTSVHTIGLFGGSTLFGLYNSQAQTIAAYLQRQLPDSVQLINYAIGGYSSTTELMTLLEVIRHTKLDEVIFYDGVNELVMLMDGLGARDFSQASYEVMGHYFSDTKIAIRNTFNLDENFDKDDPMIYKILYGSFPELIRRVRHLFFRNKLSPIQITDQSVSSFAQQVIRIYLNNIQQVRQICAANGIKVHFVWQPHIMNTNKTLTEEEAGIKGLDKNRELKVLALEVEKLLQPYLAERQIHDFSGSFDAETITIFLDWCHVNARGNELVADGIGRLLRD